MTRIEPPTPEVERLLAAERDFPPEGAAWRERSLARARDALGSTSAQQSVGFWRSRRGRLFLAASLVLVVAAVAVAQQLSSRPRAEPRAGAAPTASQTPALPSHAASAGTASPVPQTLPQDPARYEQTLPHDTTESVRGQRRSSPADDYSVELGLLQRAREALAGGRYAAALAAVAEHQRRFPKGHLREEREALRVKALASLGRAEEAGRAAEDFRRHFPNSVLAPRIEEGIRKKP